LTIDIGDDAGDGDGAVGAGELLLLLLPPPLLLLVSAMAVTDDDDDDDVPRLTLRL
jgi:hypothetical protein